MAKKRNTKKAPWDQPEPSGTTKKALTPKRKAAAKKAARKAGRPYPNLVDNMREATKQRAPRKAAKGTRAKGTRAVKKR